MSLAKSGGWFPFEEAQAIHLNPANRFEFQYVFLALLTWVVFPNQILQYNQLPGKSLLETLALLNFL